MASDIRARRRASATSFIGAAWRYWFIVFPRIRSESRYWHQRAEEIRDPLLRELALEAHKIKRSNIEGAAAFSAFAPAAHRTQTIRAQVAFQTAYDYADTLAEQPNDDPVANGRHLHQALLAAIAHSDEHPDYYACFPHREDGGYLKDIVNVCRAAVRTLPSLEAIREPAQRLTMRIVAYQSLNLKDPQGGHRRLKEWALAQTRSETGLRWWETAAAAGSSLGLFALIAAAAQPSLLPREACAIEQAYWPWIGALHSLLDSVVDEAEDTAVEQRSLLDYYENPEETAARLGLLADAAADVASTLPNAHEHALLLAAMAGSYLASSQASSATAMLVSKRVTETLGPMTKASIALLRVRDAAEQTVQLLRANR